MKKSKLTGIFVFTALLSIFIFSIGFQGVMSFWHAVQSKTAVKVVGIGSEKVRNYSRQVLWVVPLNDISDTLIFSENIATKVGDTLSIWNGEKFWIKPFFLPKTATDNRPPARTLFTGWVRSDSGLGFLFCLIGGFVFVVSVISIKRS